MKSAQRAIPLAKPVLDEREVELVSEVLRSGRLSLGPVTQEFERRFAGRVGAQHARDELHLALADHRLRERDLAPVDGPHAWARAAAT